MISTILGRASAKRVVWITDSPADETVKFAQESVTSLKLEAEVATEPKGTDVFVLNIGGKETATTFRSTLTIIPNNMLADKFSGRWDHNFHRSKDGSYLALIDRKPELFVPLLDFLRDLSVMTPHDKQSLPPMTPSFTNPLDESQFRRMVDGYGLTTTLYAYDIYEFGRLLLTWNCRTCLSTECSVMDVLLERDPAPECRARYFCLDRPEGSLGVSHGRKVKAFEVLVGRNSMCHVGWIHRGTFFGNSMMELEAETRDVLFCCNINRVGYKNGQGRSIDCKLPKLHRDDEFRIHCNKRNDTGELEFRIDGVPIVASNNILKENQVKHLCFSTLFGWSVPQDYEMIPYLCVTAGVCRFSDIELE
ncbi:hypothetical protein MPSEU_000767100 [Mayamaea pseudoterrestris]|nr:hypothetical protein MPSEU_000767100 [Mayamaea pseudoterrestris]